MTYHHKPAKQNCEMDRVSLFTCFPNQKARMEHLEDICFSDRHYCPLKTKTYPPQFPGYPGSRKTPVTGTVRARRQCCCPCCGQPFRQRRSASIQGYDWSRWFFTDCQGTLHVFICCGNLLEYKPAQQCQCIWCIHAGAQRINKTRPL